MNQHPQHFNKFSLINDPMYHITVLLFALVIISWTGVDWTGERGGALISLSLYPLFMSDPNLWVLYNTESMTRMPKLCFLIYLYRYRVKCKGINTLIL